MAKKFFISTFRAACYATTISMIIFWVHKCFVLDEDLCLVDYQPIYSDTIEAPVLSLCILDPFLDEQLQALNHSFNSAHYKEFLMGELDDEELLKVDYNSVTWNLSDYIGGYRVNLNNGTGSTLISNQFLEF